MHIKLKDSDRRILRKKKPILREHYSIFYLKFYKTLHENLYRKQSKLLFSFTSDGFDLFTFLKKLKKLPCIVQMFSLQRFLDF